MFGRTVGEDRSYALALSNGKIAHEAQAYYRSCIGASYSGHSHRCFTFRTLAPLLRSWSSTGALRQQLGAPLATVALACPAARSLAAQFLAHRVHNPPRESTQPQAPRLTDRVILARANGPEGY